MGRVTWLLACLCWSSVCAGADGGILDQHQARAERYFRAVYGCQPSVIDELAAGDIVITYPIFQEIFGKSAIRGREAVKAFAAHFCSKWTEGKVTIDQAIAGNDAVVLVWTFSARDSAAPTTDRHTWGGITVLRFDAEGRIAAEIGEESTPGPMGRLTMAPDQDSG